MIITLINSKHRTWKALKLALKYFLQIDVCVRHWLNAMEIEHHNLWRVFLQMAPMTQHQLQLQQHSNPHNHPTTNNPITALFSLHPQDYVAINISIRKYQHLQCNGPTKLLRRVHFYQYGTTKMILSITWCRQKQEIPKSIIFENFSFPSSFQQFASSVRHGKWLGQISMKC